MVGIVHQSIDSFRPRTVGATEDLSFTLDSMSQDPASTAIANGSDHMRRALERIKSIGLSADCDIETIFIGVSAVMASFHGSWIFAGDVPALTASRLCSSGDSRGANRTSIS